MLEVLAMVKQLGLPTFFMTLSCVDLRWNELIGSILNLTGKDMSQVDIDKLSYFECCDILNSNPVLLARHFQYRVETFFEHIVFAGWACGQSYLQCNTCRISSARLPSHSFISVGA